MWGRWQKGESLSSIARLFDRAHSSIQAVFAETGGMRSASRRRSRLALTVAEREEISRGVVAGCSRRSIAASLVRCRILLPFLLDLFDLNSQPLLDQTGHSLLFLSKMLFNHPHSLFRRRSLRLDAVPNHGVVSHDYLRGLHPLMQFPLRHEHDCPIDLRIP